MGLLSSTTWTFAELSRCRRPPSVAEGSRAALALVGAASSHHRSTSGPTPVSSMPLTPLRPERRSSTSTRRRSVTARWRRSLTTSWLQAGPRRGPMSSTFLGRVWLACGRTRRRGATARRAPLLTCCFAGGGEENRTPVQGFAGPCLNHSATPPPEASVVARRGAVASCAQSGSGPSPSPWYACRAQVPGVGVHVVGDVTVLGLRPVQAETGLHLGPVDHELQADRLLGVAGVVAGHLDVVVRVTTLRQAATARS